MHSRPIINTRDEPHAAPEKYRRLHVIVGDANMSEVTNYLKVGTMAIVLSMVEDDFIDRDLSVDSPVAAFRRVSRDLTCRDTLRLTDGRALTAVGAPRPRPAARGQLTALQYHDVRPGKGLYGKLEEAEAVERITTDDEISKAIYDPPKDTRAYFRGMCLQRYAEEIVSASWDSVIFDLKEGPLKKIFILEPPRGTEAHVREIFADSPTAGDLVRTL